MSAFSDYRTLNKGDSGSIVYEVRGNDKLRPLAMFTGPAGRDALSFGDFYQAVFLSPALEDIRSNYPSPTESQEFILFGEAFRSAASSRARPPPSQQRSQTEHY